MKIRIKSYRISCTKAPRRLFILELEGAALIGGLRLKKAGTYFKVYSHEISRLCNFLFLNKNNYHCDIPSGNLPAQS